MFGIAGVSIGDVRPTGEGGGNVGDMAGKIQVHHL